MVLARLWNTDGGFLELEFRAQVDCTAPEGLLFLGEYAYAELFAAARGRTGFRLPEDFFSHPAARLFHVNGWQSWSFAGELRWAERPRRAAVKRALNLYVDHPAEAELRVLARGRGNPGRVSPRPDHISHFFAVLRDGDARFGLISLSPALNPAQGDSPRQGPVQRQGPVPRSDQVQRQGPPLSFLLGGDSVRIYAYAEGGSFAKDEIIARIALVPAGEGFAFKDALASLFPSPGQASRIGGFETWYSHYLQIDESVIAGDLKACASDSGLIPSLFPRAEGAAIFQIDDGWEREVGDWRPQPSKFPKGMEAQADAIRASGFVPGLWFAPFLLRPGCPIAREKPEWILKDHEGNPVLAGWNPGWGGNVWCLDLSLPEVEEYILGLLGTAAREWGFSYLKLDFLYAGLLRGVRRGRPGGAWEHYARILRSLSERNPGLRILSCGAPIETTAPLAPLMRVGADTREHWDWPILRLIGHQGRPAAKVNLQHSIGRAVLNRSLLLSDPDVIFLSGGGPGARRSSLGEREKHLIALVAWMFGSQIMSSDLPRPRLDPGSLEERILEYCRRLGEGDFWVERLGPARSELYRLTERGGQIYGAINLSSKAELFALEAPGSGDEKSCALPPRSIILFGLPDSA